MSSQFILQDYFPYAHYSKPRRARQAARSERVKLYPIQSASTERRPPPAGQRLLEGAGLSAPLHVRNPESAQVQCPLTKAAAGFARFSKNIQGNATTNTTTSSRKTSFTD